MLDTPYPRVIPGPPRPSRILTPASLSAHSGVERYEVPGCGALMIPIAAGDRVTITNTEGGQPAELVAADDKGRIDAAILGAVANSDAAGLKALLSGGPNAGSGLGALRPGLDRRGIDLARAGALALFEGTTPAGTEQSFTISRAGMLIVAAPGRAMSPHDQNTATPIGVQIQRATLRMVGQFDLPDPLAEPVLDLRVKSATARSYFVKAGDYIQVIDVDGRQCTDFQCFSARKLGKGIERALDVTTTRSLMGHAYSMPGLHSKYYDHDVRPLV